MNFRTAKRWAAWWWLPGRCSSRPISGKSSGSVICLSAKSGRAEGITRLFTSWRPSQRLCTALATWCRLWCSLALSSRCILGWQWSRTLTRICIGLLKLSVLCEWRIEPSLLCSYRLGGRAIEPVLTGAWTLISKSQMLTQPVFLTFRQYQLRCQQPESCRHHSLHLRFLAQSFLCDF